MMGGHSVFVNKVVCAAAMLTQGAMRTMAFVGELIPVLPFPDRLWCNSVLLGKIHLFTIKRIFGLVIDFGTSQSPKSTRPLTTYLCPSRPGHQALRNNFASSLLFHGWQRKLESVTPPEISGTQDEVVMNG